MINKKGYEVWDICAGILPPDAKSLKRTISSFLGKYLHYRVGHNCVSTVPDTTA